MAAKRKNEGEPKERSQIVKYVWKAAALVFVLVTGYVIVRNVISIIDYRLKISHLKGEKERYQNSITADSTLIEHLNYDDYLERYARERYRMHRSNEQVFITPDR